MVLLRSGSFELAARTTSDAKGNFRVELDPGPYWLVARDAAQTYLDTAFLFTPGSTHVLLPVPRDPSLGWRPDEPSEKTAVVGDRLGDINGTGEVNHWDMMLLLYHLVGWPVLDSSYNFDLADINSDGATDWTDLALLGSWIYTNPKPVNTYRIGEPINAQDALLQAFLSPDPAQTTFIADGETWHPFTVSVTTAAGYAGNYRDRVNVKSGNSSRLKVSRSSFYGCDDNINELETSNGQSVFLLACQEGSVDIMLDDEDGNQLKRYAVEIERDSETSFNIELVFVPQSSYTERQKDLFRQAAARWERVITGDIPDYEYSPAVPFDSRLLTGDWAAWWDRNWSSSLGDVLVDDAVDDVQVFVSDPLADDDYWGRGGPIQRRFKDGTYFPILSGIEIYQDLMRQPNDTISKVIIHELGHALGFGSIWNALNLLENPSGERAAYLPLVDTYFSGAKAITAFNWAGGNRYRGNKVPVENDPDLGLGYSRDSHWRESVMGGEIMTSVLDGGRSMSTITIQAMADMGYEVDVSEAESYSVPRQAAKVVSRAARAPFCQVIHPPPEW